MGSNSGRLRGLGFEGSGTCVREGAEWSNGDEFENGAEAEIISVSDVLPSSIEMRGWVPGDSKIW